MEFYNSIDEVIKDISSGAYDVSEVVSFLRFNESKHEKTVLELEDEIGQREDGLSDKELEIEELELEIEELEREKRQMFTGAFLVSDIFGNVPFDGTVLYNNETVGREALKYLIKAAVSYGSFEQIPDIIKNISEDSRIALEFISHRDNS